MGISDDILCVDTENNLQIVDYIHYSVMMSKSDKQAVVSAANLDQNEIQKVSGRNWFVDPRIGQNNQIGPKAYKNNPWDRGHLTRRTAVTWGSKYIAKRASNDSCSYANSSMQHENFNQDEWRVPEEIVRHFDKDLNGRLLVFTGPLRTKFDRWYTTKSLKNSVRIPGGFWKVVAYIDKESKKLESQAYIMYQDGNFLIDKRGRFNIDINNYQVTITEIEYLTGLEFDKEIFDSNPLYFYEREGITKGPEGYEVPKSTEINELNKGVIFSKEFREKPEFKMRRREIEESDFLNYINTIHEEE